ncbi:efflux RND transporter periplasmic adaptor subunit [Halopseudomonas salegens]|uniref:Membrane fusion protein, multidrug efflux system n=1 Tax=Halopseudomonas salegens TaxID=1434072 RepID=A0A1H2FPV7_9GAMM|nr:efflux RND transporter periplasmic adaptor subunit [Halopseudomonas salegens]SDU09401.1 membrane fusion protein, multidrug efflux system [Halopseudomonas salegens]
MSAVKILLRTLVPLVLSGSAGLAVAQPPAPVLVVAAEQRHLSTDIQALGTLMANETAVVTANLTETISSIHFSDGQRVKAGDLLVELNNREQQAQLEEARVALANAEGQLQRARQLVESRFLSNQELEDRQREYDIARARIQAVEARLADRQIRAPFDSVVGLREVSVGSLLTPGTPVATLHDDSVMKLDFRVPETRMAELRSGLMISATSGAWPDTLFEGEISVLDNEVDPVTRTVRVRALIPNPQGLLRPGMLMSVRIASLPRQSLVIPEEALLPRGLRQFVMRLDAGEDGGWSVTRQQVELGQRFAGYVEILSGLAADDKVVSHGGFKLRPGQSVSIKAELDIGQSVADTLRSDDAVN